VIEIQTAWKVGLIIRKTQPSSIEEMQRPQRIQMLGVEVAAATSPSVGGAARAARGS
jgi:hypothetical protein